MRAPWTIIFHWVNARAPPPPSDSQLLPCSTSVHSQLSCWNDSVKQRSVACHFFFYQNPPKSSNFTMRKGQKSKLQTALQSLPLAWSHPPPFLPCLLSISHTGLWFFYQDFRNIPTPGTWHWLLSSSWSALPKIFMFHSFTSFKSWVQSPYNEGIFRPLCLHCETHFQSLYFFPRFLLNNYLLSPSHFTQFVYICFGFCLSCTHPIRK